MTEANKKDKVILKRILYIHYPLRFYKDKENKVQALINLSSKLNSMTPAYRSKLGLKIYHIDVGA